MFHFACGLLIIKSLMKVCIMHVTNYFIIFVDFRPLHAAITVSNAIHSTQVNSA